MLTYSLDMIRNFEFESKFDNVTIFHISEFCDKWMEIEKMINTI